MYVYLLFPIITTLDTISTPRPRVALFLHAISDLRNPSEDVPPPGRWQGRARAHTHTTTKSACYTNATNTTRASTIKDTRRKLLI